jgi:hypothetical protein
VVTGVGAASFMFTPAAQAGTGIGHHLYRDYASAGQWSRPSLPSTGSGSPDLPHVPGPDRTLYTSWDTIGTAPTFGIAGPVGPASWDGWQWCGPWGLD